MLNSSTFQGLLCDSPTEFKDYKFMKNTAAINSHNSFKLIQCIGQNQDFLTLYILKYFTRP